MYQIHWPAPPLRPFIDNYWFLRAAPGGAPLREAIYVDGKADILFNFGCPYDRWAPGAGGAVPFANLDSQRDYPVQIAQEGAIHLIGVRFHVGGLAAFLHLPMHEIANQVIDLRASLGPAGVELEGRLYDAPSPAAQAQVLDAFFMQRLRLLPAHQTALELARRIAAAEGRMPIRALSREAGYSIRTVDRLFRQYIGLSPKLYAQVQRFQRALPALSTSPSGGIAQVAVALGYYDQAHLTHEFTRFAGQSPEQYRLSALADSPNPQRAR